MHMKIDWERDLNRENFAVENNGLATIILQIFHVFSTYSIVNP